MHVADRNTGIKNPEANTTSDLFLPKCQLFIGFIQVSKNSLSFLALLSSLSFSVFLPLSLISLSLSPSTPSATTRPLFKLQKLLKVKLEFSTLLTFQLNIWWVSLSRDQPVTLRWKSSWKYKHISYCLKWHKRQCELQKI